MPETTVIIPAYNRVNLLRETVRSVMSQSYRDFELVIVDDGSTDDARGALQDFSETLGDRFRFIRISHVGSASRPLNVGILAARGEYIAILGSDDLWSREKLSRQLACIKSNPDTGMLHTNVGLIDSMGNALPARHELTPDPEVTPESLFLRNGIVASSVLISRECISRVGQFDEGLDAAEDYDLWCRISRRYSISYIHEPLVFYRIHENRLSDRSLRNVLCQAKVKERQHEAGLRMPERIQRQHLARAHVRVAEEYLSLGDIHGASRALHQATAWNAGEWRAFALLALAAGELVAGPKLFWMLRRIAPLLRRVTRRCSARIL